MDIDFKAWAQKLIDSHKNPSVRLTLPHQKLFYLASTDEERDYVQSSLEAYCKIIKLEQVEKRNSRSEAEWVPENRIAQLNRQVGATIKNFGYCFKKKRYLLPLEALFLLETNRLELTWNDVPLSLQQAYYIILAQPECTLRHYLVNKKLIFNGFKVSRPTTHLKSVEEPPPKKKCLDNASQSSSDHSSNDSTQTSIDNYKNIRFNTGTNYFTKIFQRLQYDGPKPCNTTVTKDCTYKISDNNGRTKSELNLFINLDDDLDTTLGFLSTQMPNISAITSKSVDFYTINKINLPNLF